MLTRTKWLTAIVAGTLACSAPRIARADDEPNPPPRRQDTSDREREIARKLEELEKRMKDLAQAERDEVRRQQEKSQPNSNTNPQRRAIGERNPTDRDQPQRNPQAQEPQRREGQERNPQPPRIEFRFEEGKELGAPQKPVQPNPAPRDPQQKGPSTTTKPPSGISLVPINPGQQPQGGSVWVAPQPQLTPRQNQPGMGGIQFQLKTDANDELLKAVKELANEVRQLRGAIERLDNRGGDGSRTEAFRQRFEQRFGQMRTDRRDGDNRGPENPPQNRPFMRPGPGEMGGGSGGFGGFGRGGFGPPPMDRGGERPQFDNRRGPENRRDESAGPGRDSPQRREARPQEQPRDRDARPAPEENRRRPRGEVMEPPAID
jgi:hypothetical protein